MFSFDGRKKQLDIHSHIRRILDLTVPNYSGDLGADRSEPRFNRVIPTVLCPWEKGRPEMASCTFATTRDLASEGVGLVLPQPFRAEEVLLGFWLEEAVMEQPWFFLGRAQSLRRIGGGYWTLGVQLTEYKGAGCRGELAPLRSWVERLQPEPALA